jgi:hypothetical protein
MNLHKQSTALLVRENSGEQSLSIYTGELTPENVAKCVARVKVAFHSLPKDFFALFIERMKEKGFNDQRMIDSINHVIDTCQFPTPTMANFLSFDKRVKVLTYAEMCNLVTGQGLSSESFAKLRINGNLYWIRKADKDLHGIPDEI